MTLSVVEKQAGRLFRDGRQAVLDALNAEDPPGGDALAWWEVYGHDCPAAAGARTGIRLREHYEVSGLYLACGCFAIGEPGDGFPHAACKGSAAAILLPGRLAFIWKEGRCRCGLLVRSSRGITVVAADRPPRRRPRGGQASAHPGDPGLART